MMAISLATAVYLVALLADAPGLGSEANGPGGLLSVELSIALQLALMGTAAAYACVSSGRVWSAVSRPPQT
jgi:hypothetical protein